MVEATRDTRFRLDSRAAEPIVRELFRLWKNGSERSSRRLRLNEKVFHICARFGVRLSKWQVWRLERQFRRGNVWVDEEGTVFRKPRGVVAKQEEFIKRFYGLGLHPNRELFREAMKRVQSGESVEDVIRSIVSGGVPKVIAEKSTKKTGKLRLQNRLIGPASAYARYLLCLKFGTVGHVPIREHRKLTGELLREWYKKLKNSEKLVES